MTPERNENKENGEDRELGSPTRPESPSPPPLDATSWIMQGFNRLYDQLDGLEKDVGDLKVQIARVEENVKPVPQIDKRLRRVEWVVFGVVMGLSVIWGAVKVFQAFFTIVPKP